MKSYLKTALFTSIVMFLLLGGVSIYFLRSSQSVKKERKQQEEKQLDKKVYGMEQEDVSGDKPIPLYLDGENKNVVTFSYDSVKDIYNPKKSKETAEELTRLKKKNSYNAENPLWSYNPFGTSELSLYLYFKTAEPYTAEYTIHTEDGSAVDFNRDCLGNSSGARKEHEYRIFGLVPGKENFIILKLYNTGGEMIARKVYTITPPKVKGVDPQLMEVDGKSQKQVSHGLYFFLGHDWENKKAPKGIWIYDNSGVLRGAIPIVSGRTMQILELEDSLFYNYSPTGFAKVDRMGQVKAVYSLEKYSLASEFVYDGHGHMVFLATKKGAKTKGDRLLTLDMKTGKLGKEISLASVIKSNGKKKKDWLSADSLVMMGSNGVLLSSEKLSSLIRIQNIFSENPTVAYVIGPKTPWKKSGVTRLSYAEEGATAEPYKPSGLAMKDASLSADGTYVVSFYNNNKSGKGASLYEYTINESEGTYHLKDSFGLPDSVEENSTQPYENHMVVNSAEDCSVTEYDEDGKAIVTFKYHISNYTPKVYKKDMRGFWFQ